MTLPSSLRLKQSPNQKSNQGLPSSLKLKKKNIQSDIPQDFPLENENDIQRDIERSQAQLTSRSLEAVAGLPSDLINFGASLFGFEPNLPGSQKLREISEKVSGGYTKPKNEFEEVGGELFQDIAMMAIPGAKHYSFARNLGIPVLGNLLKQGLKYSNADEKSQAYAKMGTMIALDLISQRRGMGGGAKQFSGNLFRQAEELIPEGATVEATQLQKNLSNLEKSLKMGGKKPSTQKALEKISEIQNEIKDGKIGVKELMAYRPSINEAISEYGGFDIKLNPAIKRKAINNLQEVKKSAINAIEEWGKKESPEFLKLNRSANEAWAAYENSNKISSFIQKNASKFASPLTKSLFGLGTVASAGIGGVLAPSATLAATGAGAIGAGGYQAFKVLNRVTNSPTLRKYYGNILSGASKGNAGQVIRNIKALDKELEQDSQEKSL